MKEHSKKPLWRSGIFLILLGAAHVPFLLFDNSDWEGSVSWRKPILFGISTGLTLCSLGWLVDHLERSRRLDTCIAWLTAISLVLEVGLITMQRWRGVASHFNRETAFDSGVDLSMLILICLAFAGIIYFTVRCFWRLDLGADYAIALRSGMLFLSVSCVIGFVISAYGYQRASIGLAPETVGERGVVKFPHGIAIHALQILPFVVWLMRKYRLQVPSTTHVVWCLSISFAMQIAFACYQTSSGQGRFEFTTTWSFYLGTLCVLVTIPAIVITVRHMLSKPRTIDL